MIWISFRSLTYRTLMGHHTNKNLLLPSPNNIAICSNIAMGMQLACSLPWRLDPHTLVKQICLYRGGVSNQLQVQMWQNYCNYQDSSLTRLKWMLLMVSNTNVVIPISCIKPIYTMYTLRQITVGFYVYELFRHCIELLWYRFKSFVCHDWRHRCLSMAECRWSWRNAVLSNHKTY